MPVLQPLVPTPPICHLPFATKGAENDARDRPISGLSPDPRIWLLLMRRRAGAGVPSNRQKDWDVFPQSTQILTGPLADNLNELLPSGAIVT